MLEKQKSFMTRNKIKLLKSGLLILILVLSIITYTYAFEMKSNHSQQSENVAVDLTVLADSFINPIKEGARYVIDKNYDLKGETIKIPKGCVLYFAGGTITNGTLFSEGATIESPLYKIFTTDVKLDGYWQNHSIPVEWYGAVGNDKTNCTDAINAAINNTTLSAVSLVPGGKYVITGPIKMRSSNLAFGCFEVNYSHENSPAAYIYSDCPDHIIEFPRGEGIKGINLKGIVLRKRWKYNYQGDGIHIEGVGLNRSSFEGVRVYYCNHGFYQHFGKGYKGYSLNKMQNCVFSGCRYGFMLEHDTGGQHSFWVNLNSWDNCQFGFNLQEGLTIKNVYSCEQNLFSSCGFEGISMDENTKWNNNYDLCSVRMNGQGYGVTTFLNCYFERNHPKHAKVKASTKLNENSQFCVADVIIEGSLVAFDKCTFNEGITPVVVRNGHVGIKMEDCVFRSDYESDYPILFKDIQSQHLKEDNFFYLDTTFISPKYKGVLFKEINCKASKILKVN